MLQVRPAIAVLALNVMTTQQIKDATTGNWLARSNRLAQNRKPCHCLPAEAATLMQVHSVCLFWSPPYCFDVLFSKVAVWKTRRLEIVSGSSIDHGLVPNSVLHQSSADFFSAIYQPQIESIPSLEGSPQVCQKSTPLQRSENPHHTLEPKASW
jgi:hypothetical protein